MTPERRAAETAKSGQLAFLAGMMRKQHYAMAGYTPLEEAMWLRFNRCCHQGRKITIKNRVFYMRPGKVGDNLVIRRPRLRAT